MANFSFPLSVVQSEDGMEFVRHAFANLPLVRGDEAQLMLGMLYDEYMAMAQYTAQSLQVSPMLPLRQSGAESYGEVSKEKERMELYVALRVAEYFPGMNWREFNRLTPEQTEWALEIVQSEARKKGNAENAALKGLQSATQSLQQANL